MKVKHISFSEAVIAAKQNKPFRYGKKKNKELYDKSKAFKKVNGFHYEDCFNLDCSIAAFVLPRIAYFRDNNDGIPSSFLDSLTPDEQDEKIAMIKWKSTLDTIIYGFYLKLTVDDIDFDENEIEVWSAAKELFAKYFDNLWE